MDSSGRIHHIPEGTLKEELKAQGLSELSDDELEFVMDFPEEQRVEKLEGYRLKKIEKLEQQVRAKERQLRINRRPVNRKKVKAPPPGGNKTVSKSKKKIIKNSKRKNRKK